MPAILPKLDSKEVREIYNVCKRTGQKIPNSVSLKKMAPDEFVRTLAYAANDGNVKNEMSVSLVNKAVEFIKNNHQNNSNNNGWVRTIATVLDDKFKSIMSRNDLPMEASSKIKKQCLELAEKTKSSLTEKGYDVDGIVKSINRVFGAKERLANAK